MGRSRRCLPSRRGARRLRRRRRRFGRRRRQRRRLDQRRDRRQPADEGHRGAHAVAVHQGVRHQGELHGARRGHPAPGHDARRRGRRPAVRRGDDRAVRGAAVRRETAASSTSRRSPARTRRTSSTTSSRACATRLSVDGKLYAAPFYAESSFLMYRKDVLKKAGVDDAGAADVGPGRGHRPQGRLARHGRHLPARQARLGRPRRVVHDGAEHLRRHLVVARTRTARSARRRSTSPSSRRRFSSTSTWSRTPARRTPPTRASTSAWRSTRTARWPCGTTPPSRPACSRPTTAPVKGKNGYAPAPVKETDASGWLWSWALAIPRRPEQAGPRAGSTSRSRPAPSTSSRRARQIPGGWAAIPPGTRESTYEIPEYKKAAAAFADPTLEAMAAAPIDNPGTTPRPGLPGVQYRRHPGVPGRRQPVHPAVLGGDRRADVDRRCAGGLPAGRLEGQRRVTPAS